jgi:glycerol-3-phosphate acyltransferase PlsY
MQLVAYAVPLAVLPSSIWRLPAAFDDGIGLGEKAYIVLLSILSEALAFTAIGLIAGWGEVFPRWMPFLQGRRVPTKATVILAAIGATILTLITVLSLVTQFMGTTLRGDDLPANFPTEVGGWETAWFYVCYAPLILWGPLLAVLTVAYWKRRAPQNVHARA